MKRMKPAMMKDFAETTTQKSLFLGIGSNVSVNPGWRV
jgi:hypothetical protein